MQRRIVITGGPGTGKTSLIKELEKRDIYCYHEVIREITDEAKSEKNVATFKTNPIAIVEDSLNFNRRILNGRIQQYNESKNLKDTIVFFDRGIPDVLAYMDFFDQPYDNTFTVPCEKHIYDEVYILPPWKEIYKVDSERFESYEEALLIHSHLEKTYKKFGYELIYVPFGKVSDRVDFILEHNKES